MKDSEIEARIGLFKNWYPWEEIKRGGRCHCCRRYSNRGVDIAEEHPDAAMAAGTNFRYARLCPSCWIRWEALNQAHLVAWRLME